LRFTQNNKKLLEIYFGKEESKCKSWYDSIKEAKSPVKKSKTMIAELKDSFRPLKGLEEEEKMTSNFMKKAEEEKKVEIVNSSTQYIGEVKDVGTNTQQKEGKHFGSNTQAPVLKDANIATIVKSFKELSVGTERTETLDADTCTVGAELVDSCINTNQIEYVDSNKAEEIAQN
jgi:hypothetical protein